VAEDHEDTRYLLRTLLERRGLAVVEAADGVEAMDVAERERPDLILMDGGLPLLDGIATTRRLRAAASHARVPIVFLSGHAGPQHQQAARDAGCDEYVVKPFETARLDGVLDRLLPRGAGDKTTTDLNRSMMQATLNGGARVDTPTLFGLIELDAEGTVLYSHVEPDAAAAGGAAPDFTGRNFFTEVAPFSNVGEFRQRLDDFSRGTLPACSMDFTCEYEGGPLAVRVLLARIRERAQLEVTKSVLVHIKRAK
jgi:two-component system cell cycle response regulator DivK